VAGSEGTRLRRAPPRRPRLSRGGQPPGAPGPRESPPRGAPGPDAPRPAGPAPMPRRPSPEQRRYRLVLAGFVLALIGLCRGRPAPSCCMCSRARSARGAAAADLPPGRVGKRVADLARRPDLSQGRPVPGARHRAGPAVARPGSRPPGSASPRPPPATVRDQPEGAAGAIPRALQHGGLRATYQDATRHLRGDRRDRGGCPARARPARPCARCPRDRRSAGCAPSPSATRWPPRSPTAARQLSAISAGRPLP